MSHTEAITEAIEEEWVMVEAEKDQWVLVEPEAAEGTTIMYAFGHGGRGVGVVTLEALKGVGSGISTELPHEKKITGAANTLGWCVGSAARFVWVTGCRVMTGLIEGATESADEAEEKK